jgi:uncharacterized membrane protein YhiD involved in acid resistance
VWLTAGLGMAAGAGQMKLAWMGFGIGLLLLLVGGPIERLLTRALRRLTGKPTRHERRVGATPRPPHAHRDEVQR